MLQLWSSTSCTKNVFRCSYFHYCINKQWDTNFPQFSQMLMGWIIRKFIQLVNFVTFSVFFFSLFWQSSMVKSVWPGTFRKWALFLKETSIITCCFYLWKRLCENLFNIEPFFMFYTEPIMLGPRFMPESVFYTQCVMLAPRFIPQSVFYTQSIVRSPCFILTDFNSKGRSRS